MRFCVFKARGILRQISAIFDAQALGFRSTLTAFQIEAEQLEAAAAIINAHPGVSHNYQRDHRFNLWFTLSLPRDLDLTEHISLLARKTSCPHFLNLPALRMFKRQVYLNFGQQQSSPIIFYEHSLNDSLPLTEVLPADIQHCLMQELQKDLALTPRPFHAIALRCDVKEETVLKFLETLTAVQKIRRFAAILRHTHAGFTANAMVVWDISQQTIPCFTDRAVTHDAISHCYERLTTSDWPYNIYTMMHGRTQADIENVMADLWPTAATRCT